MSNSFVFFSDFHPLSTMTCLDIRVFQGYYNYRLFKFVKSNNAKSRNQGFSNSLVSYPIINVIESRLFCPGPLLTPV